MRHGKTAADGLESALRTRHWKEACHEENRVDGCDRPDQQIAALQKDLKAAEQKLADLKKASVARWNKFEDDLRAALARLRKTFEKATG